MKIVNKYRHEIKFLISDMQMQLLKSSLDVLMLQDTHQNNMGYRIKSLYLDTEENRFYNETLSGLNNRSKYRIRVYNDDYNLIKLEKKKSYNNKKIKMFEMVDIEYVMSLLVNKPPIGEKQLANEVHTLFVNEGLKPKIIVEYDRYAYISKIGNIRITFDCNIRTSSRTNQFFDNPLMFPIMPNNRNILEIKYSSVLPGYLVRELKINQLEIVTFSKYAQCFSFLVNDGRNLDGYEY